MNTTENNSKDPLGEDFSDFEQVYLNMSRAFSHLGKEHWGIYCICSLRYNAPTGTTASVVLRNVWMQLLVEYPGLGMVPVGHRKQHLQLDEAGILSWAQNTFFVSDLGSGDVIAEAKPRDLPSLYYLPASSEVVLLIQHWRADALGSCMLLDRLFEIMAGSNNAPSPRHQFPPSLPSPSLESAAGASEAEDPEMQTYARKWIDDFHARAVNAGGLPFQGDSTTPPSRPARYELAFTPDQTRAITTACKTLQVSVTAAIHTALARTVFSYLGEAECQVGYTTVMAVNMRPHLPAPYNSKAHACACYVTSITPTVPYDSGFSDAARALTNEYRNWWSEKFMRSLRWIYKYHLAKLSAAPRRPAANGTSAAAPVKPPSGVTLSSLGVVERHLRGEYGPNLQVDEFRFGVSMQTRQMLLYAWTFKGRLTLSLCYNEAYYSEAMARDVVAQVAAQLERGLEIVKRVSIVQVP
ncbi:hypothetical protein MMYC01_204838 [Madurella mycetomatis]|uniref:Uncharacterized protein n=1 Tax=Madurella mycetomatis TaxID=100816 RepID=A0A175W6N5_9PEZI|nr:hypothetical protein MMYC01_204838 [Madurella mycetomatis]